MNSLLSAKHYIRTLILIGFFVLPAITSADVVIYAPGDTVTIGEFVYNDDFTPTTDDCTVTIFSPAGATLVNGATMTDDATGWHYYNYTAPATNGKYASYMECGTLIGGDLVKADKSFVVIDPVVTDSSIATSVWGSGSRTLTAFGSLAADVWNGTYASVRRLTDGNLTGGGTLATESYIDALETTVVTEVQANGTLISALNDISAADVWAHGTRSINSGTVSIDSGSVDAVWDSASSGLTSVGSIGKLIVDNLDAQVSSRGTSTLTAADVWAAATRTLSTTGVDNISAGVWSEATRTLTDYGNDITAADVWNVLSSSLVVSGSIGEQLALNIDGPISDVLTEVQNNGALIAALNDISAADVWAAGTRTLTGDVGLSSASVDAIWDTATSGLSAAGSIGKLVVDNLDAAVSSRGTSNLSAADVWASATRTLTDYSTSTIATAVWANGARTLTNYGNDITAADVWNSLTSSLTTVGSIGELLVDNVDTKMSDVLTEVQNNGALIAALNDISAADVWAAGTRTLTGDVNISTASVDAIWDTAASGLTASGSVGKLIADNLDAQVSGTSTLTAADVWSAATRTLSTTGVDGISAGVWSEATRTLTDYGNDITAADVWNVLATSVNTVGSIGKQLKDNVDVQMSQVLTEVQNNGALIAALNDISAADVWAAGTRTLTGNVNISTASVDAIWDTASAGLDTAGSIGKLVVDNLDAQVSSVGGGSLTAADIWSYATRTLSTAGVDDISAGVWSEATRTLTSYGNDITAEDVWNVLSSTLTTVGSIGEQLTTNTDAKISDVLAQAQANAVLINALNDISATDVWTAGTRTLTGTVDLSSSSAQGIWDIATLNLATAGSIGKLLVDNVDAEISSRGISNLTAADVWAAATRTLTDYSTSDVATAVWANATRTLTNYGNDITAADVWNVLASSLSVVGSIGEQVSTNLDAQISGVGGAANWNVRMGNIERVQTGYTYRTKVFILDASAEPTTPFSVPTVTLYDPDRNIVVSNIPMTFVATGVYEYTYSVANNAPQGLWEAIASTEVESGKTIQTNDYFEVAGSPAQVLINSVSSASISSISANVTITNEGLTGYEYQYEWCVVSDVNNECGGGDDEYHATAAKFINPSEDWNTALSAAVTSAGTYYFKLVVYFGTDSSGASRIFTVTAPSSGGGGGGGSTPTETVVTPVAPGGACSGADFNKDRLVDSIDFSILLYFWKSLSPFSNPCVDVNSDKKVDSVDFSIMLYQWTK